MKKQELTRAFRYVTHSSATKETTFVRTKRAEQAPPHSPTLDIPPRSHPATRQKPCLMYDFFSCGLNKAVTQVAQKEERRFGKALYRVIYCILAAPPKLGPTFLNKVDIADAYMRTGVRLEDIPSLAFLFPKSTPEEDQLVGFHLSIPMGCVESSAFFCANTKTVKDLTLDNLSTRHNALPHHLEDLADTKPPQTSTEEVTADLESDSNW